VSAEFRRTAWEASGRLRLFCCSFHFRVIYFNGFGVDWHLFAAIAEFWVLSPEIPTKDCRQSGIAVASD
jgi:hypothetical protein